jgi:hypothetical protein
MGIPEKYQLNQLHRNPPRFEACGLYTMRRRFQWVPAESIATRSRDLNCRQENRSRLKETSPADAG